MIITLPVRIDGPGSAPSANLIDQAVAAAISRLIDAHAATRATAAPDAAPITPVIASVRITP